MHRLDRISRVALAVFVSWALVVSPVFAFDPAIKVTVVVQEGDSVGGIGNVTTIDNVAVNNSGTTIVEVDTDNTDTDIDGALLRNGLLLHQEGDLLAAPAGAGINSFDSVNINNNGNSGCNFFLENSSGTSDDSGLYYNSTLLIQESDFVTAPGVSANTPYRGFLESKMNDSDEICLMCTIDDSAITGTAEQNLILIDSIGNQTAFARQGFSPPGLPLLTITSLENGHSGEFDFNNDGDVLWGCDTDAATSIDALIFKNSTLLAREGDPSPVGGRNWSSLSSPEMSMNAQGDVVFSGSLDGDSASNLIIVKEGEKFRQEGDTLPAISPSLITSFGTSGPILITDRHVASDYTDVLWYGDWDDANTNIDTGLFLDRQLLLQEGVDTIGGVVIDDIRAGIQDGVAMSDNGRYILAEVNLVGSLDTAVLLDLGVWENEGGGKAKNTKPKLRGLGQLAVGTDWTLRLTDAAPGGNAHLVIGTSRIDAPTFGGTLVPNPAILVLNIPIDANGEIIVQGNVGVGTPSGAHVYVQWVTWDGAKFTLSNAVHGVTQ